MEGFLDQAVGTLLVPLGMVLPATSRTFLPPFVAALYIRLAPLLWGGTQFDMVALVARAEAPVFTHDLVLLVLGCLALTEVLTAKSPDLGEYQRLLDPFIKPPAAMLTTFGVMSTDALGASTGEGDSTFLQVGASVASGVAVFAGTLFRSEMLEILDDLDVDEFYKIVSWAEDFFVVGAVVLLVVIPAAMLLLSSLTLASLYVAERALTKRAERARPPCTECGHPIWRHGLHCPACRTANGSPRAVGFFGLPTVAAAPPDSVAHQVRLLQHGRCPVCAAGLRRRVGAQSCPDCGNRIFASEDAITAYANATCGSLEKNTLFWCFGLGLVPIIGVIPAIVLYRTRLVTPYRRYLPRWQSLGLRWLARFISFVLLILQSFPVLGLISLPLMALANHRLHRSAFLATSRSQAKSFRRRPTASTGSPALRTMRGLARRIFVPATLSLSTVVAVLAFASLYAFADAPPACPSDESRLNGAWAERITLFGRLGSPLITERFDGAGAYDLNGALGQYRASAPGVLTLSLPAAARDYRFWVDSRNLYYVSEGGVLSVYERITDPAPPIPGCPQLLDRAPGIWVSLDGQRLAVHEDGILELDGTPVGVWSSNGESRWEEHPGHLLVNDADELLIVADGGMRFVGSRKPP